MNPVPLHPAIVHLPVALSILMPFLAGAAALAWWRTWLPGRKLWGAVAALQALLLVSAFVALRTGENEEERVEAVVAERVLEQHEEAAQVFVAGASAVLVLALAALLVPGEPVRRTLALVAVAGTVVVLGLGFRTGKAGGELVYAHGAASAYAKGGAAAREAAGEAAGKGGAAATEVDDED